MRNTRFLARRQGRQHARGSLAQVRLDRGVDRQDCIRVLDEIAEVRIEIKFCRRAKMIVNGVPFARASARSVSLS
jgi:hypothetical protein